MRLLLLTALLLPMLAGAQINRSAREFAMENIHDYIVTKVLKDKPYKSVSFGELKTCHKKQTDISWVIEHRFETAETGSVTGEKTTSFKTGRFFFYLDSKMKVVRADSDELY